MRVALTNPFAWPHVRRGSESLLHGLGRWLRSQGVDASVVAGGPVADRYRIDGLPYRTVRGRDLRRVHRDLDAEVTIVPGLARALRQEAPALAHCFLYADATAARLAKVPYCVSYGGIAVPRSFDGRPFRRRLLDAGTRGARAVVCPSRAAADHLHEAFGYRATVIPNGLDVASVPQGVERVPGRILCAATPDDARKRVEVLVDAFGVLRRHRTDVELVIAGGASRATRAALLDRLDEADRARVTFTGEVDHGDVLNLYGTAQVSCLPSRLEAFGMVLVESLAAGTPCVGARDGAIPEIVDDEVGATFPVDDAAACARALDDVLSRGDLSAACHERAGRYDWSVVGPRWIELYGRLA